MSDKATSSVELADIISVLFANCQVKENFHVAQFGVSIVEFRCLRILNKNSKIDCNGGKLKGFSGSVSNHSPKLNINWL